MPAVTSRPDLIDEVGDGVSDVAVGDLPLPVVEVVTTNRASRLNCAPTGSFDNASTVPVIRSITCVALVVVGWPMRSSLRS